MIYIVWGLLLCAIILNTHISSNELHSLEKVMEEATYSSDPKKGLKELLKGVSLDVKTYMLIGRRQTTLGVTSIMMLLFMTFTKPYYAVLPNSILMVINGLIISAMIGYTIEGGFMWFTSNETQSKDGGGLEIGN